MKVAQLDSQLCFALYSASRYITGVYRPILDPLGLTYPQFIVLMALWENDEVPIKLLAKKVGMSKATMTPLLRRLEQKKLIRRQVPDNDERQKNIILTKAGLALSRLSTKITEQIFCATGLSNVEANDLINLCRRIVK